MKKLKLITIFIVIMSITMIESTVMQAETTKITKVKAAENITEGRCGDDATYRYDGKTKTVTIKGNGEMWDDLKFENPIDNIIVENGITSIGTGWFYRYNVKNIKISDTVKTIKKYALYKIAGTLDIPASVEKVETNAIERAEKIVIRGDMKDYEYEAFGKGAKEIEIGGSADTLGYALAKARKNNLTITLANGNVKTKESNGYLVSADGKILYYCLTKRKKIVIPDTVEIIKPVAFYNKDIKEVVLGKNVKLIEDYAFYNCNIRKLTVNSKLQSIGTMAFAKAKLKKVALKNSIVMGPGAFKTGVRISFKKNENKMKTTMTKAKLGKKIYIAFCELSGINRYQVQIRKGKKVRRDVTATNKLSLKIPQNIVGMYDVEYSYKMSECEKTIDKEPVYVTVRPIKKLKNGKKIFGTWSSRMILTK